jgi:hypothetical protein
MSPVAYLRTADLSQTGQIAPDACLAHSQADKFETYS